MYPIQSNYAMFCSNRASKQKQKQEFRQTVRTDGTKSQSG